MVAVRHYGFLKVKKILADHPLLRANRSNCSVNMATFRFFRMAAVRHLGFLKVQNCNRQYSVEVKANMHHHARFYAREWSIFQDGGWPS